MKFLGKVILGVLAMAMPSMLQAQSPQMLRGADERYKVDILVVVAHPDDEGGVTPYLARAIYDEHKRVAVVYGTRGGSGGNDYAREHGPALANVREMEARLACAKLGITNVWFLDGKDTASQNVLNSLANWGHGANLEKLVGIYRLTRPEVVITWLPGVFIGENHGDHQAAGVLATEAFDLSNNPTAFPSQIASATKRLENYLENLTTWQAKKIYYFSDAKDDKQFAGEGPSYSIREVSPSQKKPYWRLALDAATPHLTQFPKEIEQISKLDDARIEKMMSDPNTGWWTDPETLIFGKSMEEGKLTDDVFAGIEPGPFFLEKHALKQSNYFPLRGTYLMLDGPWRYYALFRAEHQLPALPIAQVAEIAVKAGTTVGVPVVIQHGDPLAPLKVMLRVDAPTGWKVTSGQGELELPAETLTPVRVEVDTPTLTADELKNAATQEIVVHAEANGKRIGEVRLRVALQNSALPQ